MSTHLWNRVAFELSTALVLRAQAEHTQYLRGRSVPELDVNAKYISALLCVWHHVIAKPLQDATYVEAGLDESWRYQDTFWLRFLRCYYGVACR